MPDARLDIVGRDPGPALTRLDGREGIAVHGSVPSMAPYFEAAHVVVAPILTGAGIRVKIIEALAAGRPVVSTSLGHEGLGLEPGRHLLVEDQPERFAAAVADLLADPDRRAALAREGRARAERDFDWRTLGRRLESMLTGAVDRDRPAVGADPVADQVVRGGVQRATGFVATNLLTAIGAVALLRHLGVEDFGRYGTVIALLSIVQGVSDAGLTMTATRELSLRESDRRRELLAHVLGLRIVLTGAAVLAAVGFAALADYDRDMVLGTLIAGGGVFLMSVQSAMLLPLMVELRNGRVAISETLRQGLLTAAFLVLALAGAALLSFFVAQLVAGVALLALTPLLLAREHMVRPRWGLQELRALTAVGLPVAVSTVLGVVYLRLLVVLMSLVSGSEREIGYYVTSTRIVELFVGLPFLLITVSLPVMTRAARDDEGRVNYVTARTTEIMVDRRHPDRAGAGHRRGSSGAAPGRRPVRAGGRRAPHPGAGAAVRLPGGGVDADVAGDGTSQGAGRRQLAGRAHAAGGRPAADPRARGRGGGAWPRSPAT